MLQRKTSILSSNNYIVESENYSDFSPTTPTIIHLSFWRHIQANSFDLSSAIGDEYVDSSNELRPESLTLKSWTKQSQEDYL